MENKNLNNEQQKLANQYIDIFAELYDFQKDELLHFACDSYYKNVDQLNSDQQLEVRNAIISIDPKAINEAFASLPPASIYGSDIGDAIGSSVAIEADLAAKAETIAQVNPEVYADWQNALRRDEIQSVEQMIERNGLSLDNPGLQEFIHDASVAVGSPELYERMYKQQVESYDTIELDASQKQAAIQKIAEAHASQVYEKEAEASDSIEFE
jgi:hypothetical protein